VTGCHVYHTQTFAGHASASTALKTAHCACGKHMASKDPPESASCKTHPFCGCRSLAVFTLKCLAKPAAGLLCASSIGVRAWQET
jgi:hypothetical protein